MIVSGSFAVKPGRMVSPREPILFDAPPPPFVGRAGEKLDAALEEFALDPTGLRVLDAGASTGGFTDCLLQRGASTVLAVDVGFGQLHERIRQDDRVVVLERQNVRDLVPSLLGGPAEMIVADLSFISLRTVVEALFSCGRTAAPFVFLVKPQFEAGRTEADRGRGVIRDPQVWRRVLVEVIDAIEQLGATIIDAMVSPLRGGDGNVEFLITGHGPGGEQTGHVTPDMIDAVVEAAQALTRDPTQERD